MCGILGAFARTPSSLETDGFDVQVAGLAHRGPDDATCWAEGPFFFGHRRLSIIDLSHGRQPMATPDGRLVVTFNGEIYNYVELREELSARGHAFRTASDTEILLNGYLEWGTELPGRLIGMFAFAIADRPNGTMFLARDRFGEKPLLVAELADRVLFGSELGPLASLLPGSRELNAQALADYLCLNYVPGEETLLQGIRRVAPGTWRSYDRHGAIRSARFWTPPENTLESVAEKEAVRTVEQLLGEATRLALRSDVPVGIFLSGGIDSALIARFASEVGQLAHAFCLTFGEASYSEWDRARLTAEQLRIPLTQVRMGPEAMERFLDVVRHADDPLADSSSLAVWTLAREAARRVKVVLSGDGGDELFGGYLTYRATEWHALVTSRAPSVLRRPLANFGRRMRTSERKVSTTYKLMRFLRAIDLSPAEAHFTWNGAWLPAEAGHLLRPGAAKAAAPDVLRRLVAHHRLPARPRLQDLQRADVAEYLPNDILAKADRMSMAHGLEVRAPFLNPALADYALRLPAHLKLGATGSTKRLLRTLARARYADAIAFAGKQGFSIPVHTWLRGPSRPLVEDLLSRESIARLGVLDDVAVRHAVDAHMSGRRSLGFELWGLMVLVAWHRRHVETKTPAPGGAAPEKLTLAECCAGAAG